MEATVTRPHIRIELIPDHTRKDIGQAALNGLLGYKRWLEKHPNEKHEFEERCVEARKRYPVRNSRQK